MKPAEIEGRIQKAEEKLESLNEQKTSLLDEKAKLLVKGKDTVKITDEIGQVAREIKDTELLIDRLQSELEQARTREYEKDKKAVLNKVERLVHRQVEALRRCSQIRKDADKIITEYLEATHRLNESIGEYKRLTGGELYFRKAPYAPATVPGPIGALDAFVKTAFPPLEEVPQVSETPPQRGAPPSPPDRTPSVFRVISPHIDVGGNHYPEGTKVVLPAHYREDFKSSLEYLGPSKKQREYGPLEM